jgi:hypothetical protein
MAVRTSADVLPLTLMVVELLFAHPATARAAQTRKIVFSIGKPRGARRRARSLPDAAGERKSPG